jgi:GAF domain-containing protein
VLGDLILDPVPVRLVNIGEHPHPYGFPRAHPRMRSFLGVPILVDGVANGSLYLTEKAGGRSFTDQDGESGRGAHRFRRPRDRARSTANPTSGALR